ncbi:MAG: hypothetical protein ACLFM0_08835 [Spirochaetales bacterium]
MRNERDLITAIPDRRLSGRVVAAGKRRIANRMAMAIGCPAFLLLFAIAYPADLLGFETWRHIATGAVESDVVIDDLGNVSFSVDNRWVYRLNPEGERSFRVRLSEPVGAHIMALSDGSLVVSTEAGDIERISPSGRVSWRLLHDEDRALHTMASSNRGVIYLAYEDGGVRAVNYAGRPVWSVDTGETTELGPVLDSEGNLHIVSGTGELLVLNPQADIVHSFQLERVPQKLAIDSDDELIVVYDDLKTERIDPAAGERRVIVSAIEEDRRTAISDLFVDGNGTVSLLREDGTLLRYSEGGDREFQTVAESLRGAAAVGDGTFIVSQPEGVLRRIDESGQTLLTVKTRSGGGELSRPVVGRGGHIAVPGSEWTVHGFSLDDVDKNAFRGRGAGAAADGRVTSVAGPTRRNLFDIREFRIRSRLIEQGDASVAEQSLEDIEQAISRGDLRGMSLWASELLLTVAGDRTGRNPASGLSAELVRQSYRLLGEIADSTAASGLEKHALGAAGVSHPRAIMYGLSRLGYSYRHDRSKLIDFVYRRAGGAGVSAALDSAYLDSVEAVWRQGGALNREMVRRIASLPHTAADDSTRIKAHRLSAMLSADADRPFGNAASTSTPLSAEEFPKEF